MFFGEEDYRKVLRNELSERTRANPRYSLRAFARDLEVSPSQLSEVLNGKQGLSRLAAKRLARKLGFAPKQSEVFCNLVQSVHARSEKEREVARLQLKVNQIDESYRTLNLDAFRVVSDWYHFALLQLTKLKAFRNDPEWIARTLGITKMDVVGAVERLKKLELLEERNGRLYAVRDYVSSPDGIPSEAIRNFHKQVLEKAAVALYTQPVDERDLTASLFRVSSKRIPEAKKRIKRFRRKLSALLSEDESADRVYCLSIQFFDLTERERRS